MKYKFTLAFFVGLVLMCQIGFGQNAYRSKQTGANYSWTNIANWEMFDGVSWVAATAYPTSTADVITISATDSITLSTGLLIDQVVVDGVLAIFSSTQNLRDATGLDMEVNGKLYIGLNGSLGGSGYLQINSGGSLLFPVNNGRLRVITDNYGTTTASNPTGATSGIEQLFNNFGTFNIISGGFAFNYYQFTNYGTFNILGTSPDCYIQSTAGGSLYNAASGTINKPNDDLFFINRLANEGAIVARGTLDVTNASSIGLNSTIQIGATPGYLQLPTAMFAIGAAPIVNLKIVDGSGIGVGHDAIRLLGLSAPNLVDTRLVITGNPAAPVGTYTVVDPNGTFVTPPQNSNITVPSGYSFTVTSMSVEIQKNTSLPVLWGEFNAFDETDKVRLIWSTVQEIDASHFEVEFSTDGSNFQSVSRISAAGNSNVEKRYSFVHTSPSKTSTNFYRIKQVDINGKYTYSKTVPVKLKGTGRPVVSATPNPVRNSLQIIAAKENFKMILTDLNGKTVKTLSLAKGSQYLDVSELSTGTYYILFSDGESSFSQKIIKMR